MTQEDKQLLIKDLSARLQYNVQVLADINKTFEGGVISTLKVINLKKDWVELQSVLTPFKFDEIRPYLRPMSSMTDEERKEYKHLIAFSGSPNGAVNLVDWLNKKMFAYRTIDGKDMFELGLAIAVTKENNPYEN